MGVLAERSCRTPVTARPMMIRAQTSIQIEVNSPLPKRVVLLMDHSLPTTRRRRYGASCFTPASDSTPPLRAHQRQRYRRYQQNLFDHLVGAGIGDELRDRLGWNRWIDHHDIRGAANARDRRYFA